jgi:tetrahydromethanopterin S-methyltransferase subunit E
MNANVKRGMCLGAILFVVRCTTKHIASEACVTSDVGNFLIYMGVFFLCDEAFFETVLQKWSQEIQPMSWWRIICTGAFTSMVIEDLFKMVHDDVTKGAVRCLLSIVFGVIIYHIIYFSCRCFEKKHTTSYSGF